MIWHGQAGAHSVSWKRQVEGGFTYSMPCPCLALPCHPACATSIINKGDSELP